MSKSLQILSIIGIVIFPIMLIFIGIGIDQYDIDMAGGWGVWATFYGLALSIVALVKNRK
jgi:hypothetical protein